MTSGQPATGADLAERLSMVLLTYNCAHRIVPIYRQLQALDVPLIVVDNASVDGTGDVLESMGAHVVRMDRNVGAAARNVGAQLATTPYIAFCDDDSFFDRDGLVRAADLLDVHPQLALINAHILVGATRDIDPICVEMAASPLEDHHGIPGHVILGFMAGSVIVRRTAYLAVGGYDERFFIGAEEETLAVKLARRGWQLRYVPDITAYHQPSIANAPHIRPYALRNTLWNCWLHRPFTSALRWTVFVLADAPKDADWLRGLLMFLRGLPAVLRERDPMPRPLDQAYRQLDRRHFRRVVRAPAATPNHPTHRQVTS